MCVMVQPGGCGRCIGWHVAWKGKVECRVESLLMRCEASAAYCHRLAVVRFVGFNWRLSDGLCCRRMCMFELMVALPDSVCSCVLGLAASLWFMNRGCYRIVWSQLQIVPVLSMLLAYSFLGKKKLSVYRHHL